MKTKIPILTAALLLSTLNSQLSTAFAQGSLTPPGAPAPTMKSLAQIEPRTPISVLPFTISTAGSYYVTTNLTPAINQNGIVIAADNVTVDLNGFTLFGGGGGTGEGISASGARANIVIRNGTVRNWPSSGVNLYDSLSSQATVQNIRSISNVFTGIAVMNGSRVLDCAALGNGQRGILVDNDSVVERCKAAGNSGLGIAAGANCQLLNNQSTGNGTGLSITGTGNIVANNLVRSNADNYSIAQGNQLDLLLCELPESIDWSAKVKLVGSLNVTGGDAITITANNVTLDLGGFTISSTAPSATGTAILLSGGRTSVAIYNGHLSSGVTIGGGGVFGGGGFASGISYSGNPPFNVRVKDVSIAGVINDGILLGNGNSTVVESCTVSVAGNYGIYAASVSDSTALNCGQAGIAAVTAHNCYGSGVGSGTGLIATTANNCYGYSSGDGTGLTATTANNCYGYSLGNGDGLYVSTANNCYGYNSGSGWGLFAYDLATGCYGYSSSGIGVYTTIANNCYGQSPSGTGLLAFIASVCHGDTSTGTALSVTHGVNSF